MVDRKRVRQAFQRQSDANHGPEEGARMANRHGSISSTTAQVASATFADGLRTFSSPAAQIVECAASFHSYPDCGCGEHPVGEVSARDLIVALRNFRMLAAETKELRVYLEENHEEFESLRETLDFYRKRLRACFPLAIGEALLGLSVREYIVALLHAYGQAVAFAAALFYLGGREDTEEALLRSISTARGVGQSWREKIL